MVETRSARDMLNLLVPLPEVFKEGGGSRGQSEGVQEAKDNYWPIGTTRTTTLRLVLCGVGYSFSRRNMDIGISLSYIILRHRGAESRYGWGKSLQPAPIIGWWPSSRGFGAQRDLCKWLQGSPHSPSLWGT